MVPSVLISFPFHPSSLVLHLDAIMPKLKKEEFHLLELISLEVKILEKDELKKIGKVINLENEKNNLLVIELFQNQKKVPNMNFLRILL